MSDRTRRQLRVRGVNSPEMGTAEGPAARDYSYGLLVDQDLLIETFKTRTGSDVMTFTRYVADVWLPDGSNWADRLLEAGHAVPYP